MFYLCRYLHLTEDGNRNSEYIFCHECKQNVHKSNTYKFSADKQGRYFIRRDSMNVAQNKRYKRNKRLYDQQYSRAYRRRKKLMNVTNPSIAANSTGSISEIGLKRDVHS